jgi:hypothetical protein
MAVILSDGCMPAVSMSTSNGTETTSRLQLRHLGSLAVVILSEAHPVVILSEAKNLKMYRCARQDSQAMQPF